MEVDGTSRVGTKADDSATHWQISILRTRVHGALILKNGRFKGGTEDRREAWGKRARHRGIEGGLS